MVTLIFGALWIVSTVGYFASSDIKHSDISHLIWGVAFIVFDICFVCALYYTIGTSDLPDWVKFLLLK